MRGSFRLAGGLACGVLLLGGSAAAQQSARFRLDRVTVGLAAATPSSARFDGTALVALPGPVGASSACGFSFAVATGFWSVAGSVTVPLRLHVDTDRSVLGIYQLSWTGAAQKYGLYVSADASDVTDPANLVLSTAECAWEDVDVSDPPLEFYRVLSLGGP